MPGKSTSHQLRCLFFSENLKREYNAKERLGEKYLFGELSVYWFHAFVSERIRIISIFRI